MKNWLPFLWRQTSQRSALSGRTTKVKQVGCAKDLRVGAGIGHGEQEGLLVLLLEVLIGELLTVDGLATSALRRESVDTFQYGITGAWILLTLPRVKSPPWSMNSGMMRWKDEPL